jgi:hypothetical protein
LMVELARNDRADLAILWVPKTRPDP